jgi:heme-degrading monooxygenase HmoA
MIARIWHGLATLENAEAYYRHFTTSVVPHLKGIAGQQGAFLLRRETSGKVQFLALTLWDSIETVKKFAGQDPDVATVEPQAKAALEEFDVFAMHYEVVYGGVTPRQPS